jgi:hypothetical protein
MFLKMLKLFIYLISSICFLYISSICGVEQSRDVTVSYSSLIRSISKNKVLWQITQGTCNSIMFLNLTRDFVNNDEPIWQLLPAGTTKDQVRKSVFPLLTSTPPFLAAS